MNNRKLRTRIKAFLLTLLALCCLAAYGTAADDRAQAALLISAAASLTDVMPAIAETYAQIAPQVTLTMVYASSGTLRAQIEEGAPADVFISANQKHMDALEDQDLLLPGSNRPLLENAVVLIVPEGGGISSIGFTDIASDSIPMVGIGEPDSVPAGQYARQVFTSLGIWDAVKGKANFGTDVRQVLTWVEEGAMPCGAVYQTDAFTSRRVRIAAYAPEGSCDRIVYPAAVIQTSAQPDEALAFLAFLHSPEAANVFAAFGFSPAATLP